MKEKPSDLSSFRRFRLSDGIELFTVKRYPKGFSIWLCLARFSLNTSRELESSTKKLVFQKLADTTENRLV